MQGAFKKRVKLNPHVLDISPAAVLPSCLVHGHTLVGPRCASVRALCFPVHTRTPCDHLIVLVEVTVMKTPLMLGEFALQKGEGEGRGGGKEDC